MKKKAKSIIKLKMISSFIFILICILLLILALLLKILVLLLNMDPLVGKIIFWIIFILMVTMVIKPMERYLYK
jgi:hypothetical protein